MSQPVFPKQINRFRLLPKRLEVWPAPCTYLKREALVVAGMQITNRPSDFRVRFAGKRTAGRSLEIDSWIRSDIEAISPLVDRLMRLVTGSHCVAGAEREVELALREAVSNAVIHGNRMDSRKLVHVRCQCKLGKGLCLTVTDEGQGFDPQAVPDLLAGENLEAEHGRGIQLMKSAMDKVFFERGGGEVHLHKKPASGPKTEPKSDLRGF
jgi:serine/threonine-protein kinase RsbW